MEIRKRKENMFGNKIRSNETVSCKSVFTSILLLLVAIALSFSVVAGNVIVRNGDINASGTIYGDGSELTGVSSSGSLWTNNSGNATFDTGNVGIGVVNPQVKLHLDGVFYLENTEYADENKWGFYPWADEFQFTTRNNDYTFKAIPFRIFNDSNTSTLVLKNSNVGIGTDNPGSTLDVESTQHNSQITIDTYGTSGSIYNSSLYFRSNNPGQIISSYGLMFMDTLDNTDMVIDSSGNVGVGTTTPYHKLQVDGSFAVGPGSYGTTYKAFITNSDTIGTSGATDYQRGLLLTVSPKSSLWTETNHYTTGINVDNLLYTGNIDAGDVLDTSTGIVVQYGSYSGGANITDSYGMYLSSYQNGVGHLKNIYGIYLTDSGSTATYDNYYGIYQGAINAKNYFGGKVGIGAVNPTRKLELEDSTSGELGLLINNLNTASNAYSSLIIQTADAGTGYLAIADPSFSSTDIANRLELLSTAGADGVSIAADEPGSDIRFYSGGRANERMRIDGSGNVGIGTTSPEVKLQIEDLSTDNGLRIKTSNISTGIIQFADTESPYHGVVAYNHLTDKMQFYTVGTPRLTIDSVGNVGIGTTSPNGKLDVRGLIKGGFGAASTAGVLNWSDPSNAYAGNGNTLLLGTATDGPGPSNYFHPFNFEYSSSKNGASTLTQFAIPYGDATSINRGMYVRGRYAGTWSSWSKFLVENSAGKVGIGTTTPDHNLEVNAGTLTNSLYVGDNSNVDFSDRSGDGDNIYVRQPVKTSGGWWGVKVEHADADSDSSSGFYPFQYQDANGAGATETRYQVDITGGAFFKGNVGIGDLTPDYKLDVEGTICQDTNADGTCDGTVTSDARLKKNIEPLSGALDLVSNLQGVRFEYRNDTKFGNTLAKGEQIGFIAQDLEVVLPELIYEDIDGYKMIDYQKITAVLVESTKEQQIQIQDLKNENYLLKQAVCEINPSASVCN